VSSAAVVVRTGWLGGEDVVEGGEGLVLIRARISRQQTVHVSAEQVDQDLQKKRKSRGREGGGTGSHEWAIPRTTPPSYV
jgi:hypothetical protein